MKEKEIYMSEVVDLCRNLVRFPSWNSKVEDALAFMQKYFENMGFSARIMTFKNSKGQSVANLYASYGEGHPHLLFSGHMDVVPSGDDAAWMFPAFEGKIDNNILYGRGIADMKGGIACFADACREFVKENKFQGKISFVISGDEEEPLVDGTEKMLEQLHAEGEVFDFAIVGEPSNPKEMGDEIKVGRRGDIVLRITSFGQQGHTAYPDMVVNPIHNLVGLLNTMQTDNLDNGNKFFGPSTLQITTFDVGNPASNVVPAQAYAQIDIRFNSNHTSRSIVDWAEKHIAAAKGKFVLEPEYVGESFLSPISKNVEMLKDIVFRHTGKIPAYSTAGGTSDARFVKKYCPVVEYGLTNAFIHKVNECEKVENIELLQKIYKDFLRGFFS